MLDLLTHSLTHTCEENKESRPGGVDFTHYAIGGGSELSSAPGFMGSI